MEPHVPFTLKDVRSCRESRHVQCTSAGPLRANSGHSKLFNQLVWEIRDTASFAFCHAHVLIEINGARFHRVLYYGKPIGCARLRDDHRALSGHARQHDAHFRLCPSLDMQKIWQLRRLAPLNVRYSTTSKHSPTWAQNELMGGYR